MEHPCKKCINYTKDIITSQCGFEIEVDLCGFGIYFKQTNEKCDNFKEIYGKVIK